MQTVTITIKVESDEPRFSPDKNDIYTKAKEKLGAGEYTYDIADVPLKANAA